MEHCDDKNSAALRKIRYLKESSKWFFKLLIIFYNIYLYFTFYIHNIYIVEILYYINVIKCFIKYKYDKYIQYIYININILYINKLYIIFYYIFLATLKKKRILYEGIYNGIYGTT